MIEFAIMWFGIGVFSALMTIGQWIMEGCLIGEGPEDRFYYLSTLLQNVAMNIITGPITLIIQIFLGMPILPYKRG